MSKPPLYRYAQNVRAQRRCTWAQVCPVEAEWAEEIIPKLRDVDVKRLSGGAAAAAAGSNAAGEPAARAAKKAVGPLEKRLAGTIDAARARFLARKQARTK